MDFNLGYVGIAMGFKSPTPICLALPRDRADACLVHLELAVKRIRASLIVSHFLTGAINFKARLPPNAPCSSQW